jgi:hypothetical protein
MVRGPGQGRKHLARRRAVSEAERFRYLWATAPPRLLIIRRGKLSIDMLTIPFRALVLAVFADHKALLAAPLLTMMLAFASCSALQPLNTGSPRGSELPYPVFFNEDAHRKESIAAALNRLMSQEGNSDSTAVQLQPVTATILSLSPKANGNLYLPKVGAGALMNEEETRESLRRFIKDWQEIIGADPAKLSLVERVDLPDGTKQANYEHRPFRVPIRGNYGKLQIRFAADRRVLNLTSSCIPDAERIQTALSAFGIRVRSREAVQKLRENGVAYTDPKGTNQNFKIPAASEINPRGLVTYILPAKDKPEALEFHLAWEMELSDAPAKFAYVDAITGETVVVE